MTKKQNTFIGTLATHKVFTNYAAVTFLHVLTGECVWVERCGTVCWLYFRGLAFSVPPDGEIRHPHLARAHWHRMFEEISGWLGITPADMRQRFGDFCRGTLAPADLLTAALYHKWLEEPR